MFRIEGSMWYQRLFGTMYILQKDCSSNNVCIPKSKKISDLAKSWHQRRNRSKLPNKQTTTTINHESPHSPGENNNDMFWRMIYSISDLLLQKTLNNYPHFWCSPPPARKISTFDLEVKAIIGYARTFHHLGNGLQQADDHDDAAKCNARIGGISLPSLPLRELNEAQRWQDIRQRTRTCRTDKFEHNANVARD